MTPPMKYVVINAAKSPVEGPTPYNKTFRLKVPQKLWSLHKYQNVAEGRKITMRQKPQRLNMIRTLVIEGGLVVAHLDFDRDTFDVDYVWMLKRLPSGSVQWREVSLRTLKNNMGKGLLLKSA